MLSRKEACEYASEYIDVLMWTAFIEVSKRDENCEHKDLLAESLASWKWLLDFAAMLRLG